MKKIFIALACNMVFGLSAQNTTPVTSMIQPQKANGYICWDQNSAASFKVSIYRLVEGRYQLLSSTKTSLSYYKFNDAQMTSTDLYYTISAINTGGTVISESQPASIGMEPQPYVNCYIDCNGLRESYRLNRMVMPNNESYLTVSDEATEFYQAIDAATYQALATSTSGEHPYVKGVAYGVNGAFIYERDHIKITDTTPGYPFYNANHDVVTDGWLVAKMMDKYSNLNGVTTKDYFNPTHDWCEANIGTATIFFNQNMNPSTVYITDPASSGQSWFLPPPTINSSGQPIYQIPNQLACSNMSNAGGGVSGPGENMDEFFNSIDLCFDYATADSSDESGDPTLCLIPDGGPFGGGIGGVLGGVTFESMDSRVHYGLSIDNGTGTPRVLSQSGTFVPGLYRVNMFFTDERIVPVYRVLGVTSSENHPANINLVIAPNPIQHSILKFNVTADANTVVDILVQKLDGTTLYTESGVTLKANRTIEETVSVTGDVPYNQVRVSVIKADGTVIQQTALTQ